jgi:NlpC/P60 family
MRTQGTPQELIYTSVEDLEPDEYDPTQDGDNSIHAESTPRPRGPEGPDKRIVPFVRVLRAGSVGFDVRAVKRALSHAGYLKWSRMTPLLGPVAVRALERFQQQHPPLKLDGVYNLATHQRLAPHFDAFGVWLLQHAHTGDVAARGRRRIVAAALFGHAHAWAIHYTQGPQRMFGVRNRIRPPRIPYFEDCSSFATWCFWLAGSDDPNGLRYNGFGYTGTLARQGLRAVGPPRPGDLVFYGPYPHKHVAVYIGGNRIISHGSESGPYLLQPNYRSDLDHYRTYL